MKKAVFLGVLAIGLLMFSSVLPSFAETENILKLVGAVRDYINYGSSGEQFSQLVKKANWDEIVEAEKFLERKLFPEIKMASRDKALEAMVSVFEQLAKENQQCVSVLKPPLEKIYREWREGREREARMILVSNLLRERVRSIAFGGKQEKEE